MFPAAWRNFESREKRIILIRSTALFRMTGTVPYGTGTVPRDVLQVYLLLGYQVFVYRIVEGIGSLNLDLDSKTSNSSFHYTPWALHSDLVR